ncbi:hypothetical protein L3Q82_024569 [Scortum barcoo]|uniref:Uncharacterized protein n=1 Tax=Scortum barcoo TaxID=214431 RepID=A0ACB8WPS4_9TELE|nr:hypothetical protein L3Q82_024569 [Scortum barcoo]
MGGSSKLWNARSLVPVPWRQPPNTVVVEQELGSHCRQISRRSQGPEGVQFGNHRISSLLFADDVVLLASSNQDLQHGGVAPSPKVGGEVLPQVEFRVSSISGSCSRKCEGKMEREIDRRIGAACQLSYARSVYWTVVVKNELSRKKGVSSRFTGQSTFPPSPMVMNLG